MSLLSLTHTAVWRIATHSANQYASCIYYHNGMHRLRPAQMAHGGDSSQATSDGTFGKDNGPLCTPLHSKQWVALDDATGADKHLMFE
jgi:hypothetical protein